MLIGSRSAVAPASIPAPRVLQVVLNLQPGGTERLVGEIVKRLSPAVSSAVCCLDEAGAWATEVTERGVPVWPLRRAPGFRPGVGLRIARLAEDWGATVLHCHHYSSLVYGRIAALWNPRLRIVFTEHGRLSDAPPSRKRRLVNPVLTRFPGQLYAVSADLRAHLLAEGFPSHRTEVIYNGVDTGAVSTPADRMRARAASVLPAIGRTCGR